MGKSDITNRTLSRRNFLKTTGGAAAVAALAVGGAGSIVAKDVQAAKVKTEACKKRVFAPIKPNEDPSGKLAEMVVNTRYDDVPAEVIDVTKKIILDNLACIVAGSKWEVVPQIAELVNEWGGIPQGTVLIYGYKVPAPSAAFANGVMARAIDMGDVHDLSGHIYENVIPTLLSAVGMEKKKPTGKDFLIATIVGAEVSVRAAAAIALTTHTALGIPGEFHFSMTGAASVARLRGLSVEETWTAMGITYSVHAMAELQKYAEGTQMARTQHSFASDTAIKATLLAQRGITAPKGIFLGVPGGIFRHLPYEDFNPGYLTDDLGKKWLAVETSLKPYASCKYTHSWTDAMAQLLRKYKFDYKDIAGIRLTGSVGSRMTVEPKEAKWNPKTVGEACYSAPYAVATAAIKGSVFLEDFAPAELKRADKLDLMRKVTVDIDPNIKTPFDGFTVEVTLKNGKTFRQTSQYVLGHPKNPMSWNDVENKFWKCVPFSATQIPKAKFERAVDICKNLEKVQDMSELIDALTP
ncbi:MAG: MmgE/PrpD family protein [Smithellaceae bacterium]